MGQGRRDGQWYGRPKQGGLFGLLVFTGFLTVAVFGAVFIIMLFSFFAALPGLILGAIWFLYWSISFFTVER